jgi:hypothetical protein
MTLKVNQSNAAQKLAPVPKSTLGPEHVSMAESNQMFSMLFVVGASVSMGRAAVAGSSRLVLKDIKFARATRGRIEGSVKSKSLMERLGVGKIVSSINIRYK